MKTRRLIIILVVIAVLVGGFIGGRILLQNRAAEQLTSDLQTEEARVGSLEATVGATGTVRANQSVQQTTGTVGEVAVTLGDQVSAGDVLASLEQSSLPQTVIMAQADLVNAENALEDYLDSFNPLVISTAERKVYEAEEALEDAEDYLDQINWVGTEDEINLAEWEMQQAWKDYEDAKEDLDSIGNEESRKYKIAERVADDAYDTYAEALYSYNYYTGNTVTDLERSIAEKDLEIAQQRLSDAEEELARFQAGPDPDDVAAAEARIAAAEASLQMARVESPFAGTVTQVQIAPGDKVSPGMPAFRVDDLSSLMVDVEVSEVDINRVEVGQPVILAFDAILAAEYQGEVIEVAPVGNIQQGVVNFKVTIEIENPDQRVKPGMTAAVNVVVSQLSDVLLVPNRAVRVVEGDRIVYIYNNSELNRIKIELGASSDLYSEVVGGDLQPGDKIVLNPPSEFEQGNGPPPFVRN